MSHMLTLVMLLTLLHDIFISKPWKYKLDDTSFGERNWLENHTESNYQWLIVKLERFIKLGSSGDCL